MLPKDELKRRLDAARTLRGMTQAELAGRLHEDGFGKQDLGRIERGEMPFQRMRRVLVAEHLGVPEAWFVDPDIDNVIGVDATYDTVKSRLDEVLDELRLLNAKILTLEAAALPQTPEAAAPSEDQVQGGQQR